MSILQPSSLTTIAVQSGRPVVLPAAGARTARPWLCVAILLLADLAALTAGVAVCILTWRYFGRPLSPEFYLRLWPVLLLFPLAYAASGLYPGFGCNPASELRKLSVATSVVYPALAVTIFLLKDAPTYSRGIFLMAWAQTLFFIPSVRALVRSTCSSKSWWGYPVVVVGPRHRTSRITRTLENQPELGLKPVAMFEDPELAIPLARDLHVRHVILTTAETSRGTALDFFSRCGDLFSDVIVMPDLAGFSSLWVEARDIGGMLGLGVRQRLLLPGSRLAKRAMDLCMVVAAAPIILLLAGVIAALVKLSSPGPVFYGQPRCGKGGGPFIAWKFRSMVSNANHVLDRCLDSDPNLREEWRLNQKLRNDPRITRFGHFLRRTSLDELPQIWNVIVGEMSLVGPRPVVAEEISRYGEGFALYEKVTPGITGLWQVSGRNNLSYEQRVDFDLYYVRNWSIWLDLYILARTVKVVARGDGAY